MHELIPLRRRGTRDLKKKQRNELLARFRRWVKKHIIEECGWGFQPINRFRMRGLSHRLQGPRSPDSAHEGR